MHGWVEEADTHTAFHWGRANGWALLTLTEVLDVLPAGHPDRNEVLQQYREHVKGIAPVNQVKDSGISCWTVTTPTWRRPPPPSLSIALPTASTKAGLTPYHTVP